MPHWMFKATPSRGLVAKLAMPEESLVIGKLIASAQSPIRGATGPSNHAPELPDYVSLYASPEAQKRQDEESRKNKQRRQSSWRDFNFGGVHGTPSDKPTLRYEHGRTSTADAAITQPRLVVSAKQLKQNRARVASLGYKAIQGEK